MTGFSIGKYRLEREIARGGMGVIWVAVDTQLERRVAIKVINPERGAVPALRARLQREALAIAKLNNPHVIQIYEYGVEAESPYLVMELLDGEDLDARLRRQHRLPLGGVVGLVVQVAKALSAAHEAGVVHRDLKPANIFLARHGPDEVVKVLDFGVAVLADPLVGPDGQRTRSTVPIGTPHYMSPEQTRGSQRVDHRSDLWSLAVVAYRALVGKLPFDGTSWSDIPVNISTASPEAPSSLVPELGLDLGAAVDRFFTRALAKDPEGRFQSARELASAFAELVGVPATRPKVLVVDDEPDVKELIKQLYRKKIASGEYEFVFALDGEEALDVLRRHPDVDVVVTDINMPRMDGITLIGKVAEQHPLVKAVVVSAYGDMGNIRAAMNKGAFDFLVKPVERRDLEITVEKTWRQVAEQKRLSRWEKENQFLRMFVGDQLLRRVLPATRSAAAVRSEVIEGTVAFIDVHGFSSVLRQEAPDAAVRALNANFEVIVAEVTAQNGGVDKFMGDAVMAVFSGADHRERALDACLAIRDQLDDLAERAGEHSAYAHGVSIGVDSGKLLLGAVGSTMLRRLDYTVLGEVVSTAAKLQSLAGRGQIFIGEALYDVIVRAFECDHVEVREMSSGALGLTSVYAVKSRRLDDVSASGAPTAELTGDLSGEMPLPKARRDPGSEPPKSRRDPGSEPPKGPRDVDGGEPSR